jgi:hypothetical protein
MKQWLAPAHLALTLVIVVWNVILAGRIAQLRQATRPFATITGLAGMLLIPAFIVAIATTTVITGRGISSIDWLWPVTVVLFAGQSVYALSKKLVNPLWGYPIAFYNVFVAVAAVSRLFAAHGYEVSRPLLVIMAAQVDALALATTEAAITSPFFLHVPLISPAFPALSRLTAGFRMTMAGLALAWFGLMLAELPRADVALQSYDAHADDRLTERPRGFSLGLKLFPDISEAPSAASVRSDLETAVYTGVDVVNVVFAPGATQLAIDSVSHATRFPARHRHHRLSGETASRNRQRFARRRESTADSPARARAPAAGHHRSSAGSLRCGVSHPGPAVGRYMEKLSHQCRGPREASATANTCCTHRVGLRLA